MWWARSILNLPGVEGKSSSSKDGILESTDAEKMKGRLIFLHLLLSGNHKPGYILLTHQVYA
ncbi:hypothetical protein HKD37_02G005213 [Glycine soja]